jgi:hypothetical protein
MRRVAKPNNEGVGQGFQYHRWCLVTIINSTTRGRPGKEVLQEAIPNEEAGEVKVRMMLVE